ncbi:sulphate transporter [Paenibacillus curdlanolyticus YK9]|uniref:Sulphate transporter n=1 Tax=Paenibacillus curdlanolyticus YK9 TaxID=717606 RepID=E0I7V8_9BACL|nr:SulP family inorganic anion transporter [Paenibacillus curdlanolyticus]EFM11263.1 sulphate transporter [Paenibacillus curdlanolyticus YK9]
MIQSIKSAWLGNARADVLSGMTVALALIPEAIAFSIIAGVNPMVGLYASFTIAIVIAFTGGRSGMISAATGAMALLMVTLVKDHGLEYLFATTILTGIIQFTLGLLKFGRLVTFIPQPVMTGFVNALAILVFTAQLVHFTGAGWMMYALVGAALVIIYGMPRLTTIIPSTLAAIIIITIIAVVFGIDVRTVGDMGHIVSTLPSFHLPDVAISWDMLKVIFPYALSLAIVGLTESLLTASVLDEMTGTTSDKNREVRGQGIANVVTGFFGGMAGCAMIGQSVINTRSGGRKRLSTLVAGVFLIVLIMVFRGVVEQIPMAALVAVMFMVCFDTFDWRALRNLHRVPRSDALVMLITVGVVVATHDLSKGVLAGVVISAVVFAWRAARIRAERSVNPQTEAVSYVIQGPLFFGTTMAFASLFQYERDTAPVRVDFARSHVWDQSAVEAIGKMIAKYSERGIAVEVYGLNAESKALVERIGLGAAGGH